MKQDDKSTSEKQTSSDKKEISVAKIGLISAIIVAIIGLVSSVVNTYLPLLIQIRATQTAEARIIPQTAPYSSTSMPISPATTLSPLPTNTSSSCIPILISPTEGAILDNGRSDWLDETTWVFDWSDCAEATEYHLYVIGGLSRTGQPVQRPVIDTQKLTSSFYQYTTNSYFTGTGFTWKVRAKVNGEWGDWSAKRTFEVEDYDTDPSSSTK